MPICYELSLPPSELPHVADLVHVFDEGDASSCVSCSPGGIVRYWSNVSNAGSYVEVGNDVKGEVFSKLVALEVRHLYNVTQNLM